MAGSGNSDPHGRRCSQRERVLVRETGSRDGGMRRLFGL